MSAGVPERADGPVLSADHEQRNPGRGSGDVAARLPERGGGAEGDGESAQEGELAAEALLAPVVLYGLVPDLVAPIGRALADVREDAVDDRLVIHECLRAGHANLPLSLGSQRSEPSVDTNFPSTDEVLCRFIS